MKNGRLELRVPKFEELAFRERLLSDEETMAYNIGYGDNEGSGCIKFPESAWEKWYVKWIGNNPQKYSAFILEKNSGNPVGTVGLRYVDKLDSHCVSLIVHSKYRGVGYGEEAIKLLIKVAFEDLKLKRIHDEFPSTRIGAEKLFLKVGFIRINDDVVQMVKEQD